jgi:trans-2,3-dihydro-3-hydroxyanthranilate isomerase
MWRISIIDSSRYVIFDDHFGEFSIAAEVGMVDYVTVDVFTQTVFGGNPLAVIPDARSIPEGRLQLIAREFNYSETAFVYPPDDPAHTARVRIFTPTDEIPFAGHPNVGTAFVLGRSDDVFGKPIASEMVFEEKAGLVRIDLLRDGGDVVGARVLAPQRLELGQEVEGQVVANCVGLAAGDIATAAHAPRIVSVGLPIVVAELANLEALAAARPNADAFAQAGARYWHSCDRFSTYLYVRTGNGVENLRARMFAPLSNIPEDPATGSAAAALGAFLGSLDLESESTIRVTITQGVEMGRPSRIEVDVEKRGGQVERVSIAGYCVPVMRGHLRHT